MVECDKFERGLGIVLRNAWRHIEALQTTDIAALVSYICQVILTSQSSAALMEYITEAPDIVSRQEILCFSYLKLLLSHLDALTESRYIFSLTCALA
jgi:hypothetical protein